MARQIAPALISSPGDLIDYRVSDVSPIDPLLTDGYVERYIHSEIYKKYPEVHAVIHSHADSVIPYTLSGECICLRLQRYELKQHRHAIEAMLPYGRISRYITSRGTHRPGFISNKSQVHQYQFSTSQSFTSQTISKTCSSGIIISAKPWPAISRSQEKRRRALTTQWS